jgi:hypothetical protein
VGRSETSGRVQIGDKSPTGPTPARGYCEAIAAKLPFTACGRRHQQKGRRFAPPHFEAAALPTIRVVCHAFMPRMLMVVATVFAIIVAFAIPFFARCTAAFVNDASRA